MLPVGVCRYHIDFVHPEGISPHTHTTTSEIIQVYNNNGKIIINNHTYEFKRNSLYFIHGLAPHFIIPNDLGQYHHSILVVNTNELEQLCIHLNLRNEYKKIFTQNGGMVCSLSEDDTLKASSLFLKGQQILADTQGMKYARLASLLVDFLQLGIENNVTDTEKNDANLTSILTFINNNLSNKFTIDDISRECGFSKYYICRFFKEKTGITIGNFIKGQRISSAKHLLTTEDHLSISDISQQCGFASASFFTKTFVSVVGRTPTAFRAEYK